MSELREKSFILRMTADDYDRLSACAEATGVSRSEFLRAYIVSSYDRLNGSPELRSLLEQMKNLTEQAKAFGVNFK